MNIKEHKPLDLRDKTDKSNKVREDIIDYYNIDKLIATLVKPTMILTINNKEYKVKDKDEIYKIIKEVYFNNNITYQYTKEDVIKLCNKAFSIGASYQHQYALTGNKPDKNKVIELMKELIEYYTI